MKVVQINATCGVGSTGKICVGISEVLTNSNIENYILYSSESNGYPLGIQCSDRKYIKYQAFKSRILGNYGFNSKNATQKMIAEIERIKPDIVHLHNIHGHDCNLEILFTYFKKNKTKLVWTFHDCWAFTGYCPHFTMKKCDKWETGCFECIQRKEYACFFDNSKKLYEKKRELLKDLDLTIVTPSQWLADCVKKSFLKECFVKVIHNGIDLNIFRETKSDFRQKYGLEDKKIVLGVSFGWDIKKGLDVFCELANCLPNDFKVVLVGINESTEKQLPRNILVIHRTSNQRELAEIYTTADVFVNPTREENYPTVNMEAIACGTPVVTFRTGGSPEMLDKTCGSVVECDDVNALEQEIVYICTENPYSKEACLKKAMGYNQNVRFEEYLKIYNNIALD